MSAVQFAVYHPASINSARDSGWEVILQVTDSEIRPLASGGFVSAGPEETRATPLLVLQMPATPGVAAVIAALAQTRPVYAVIDHFYHAELLCAALRLLAPHSPGRPHIRVLLGIRMGPHQTGVRPGYDAQRLATAVDQLSELSVEGVIADCSDVIPSSPGETRAVMPGYADALTALKHTIQLLARRRIDCVHCVVICEDSPQVSDALLTQVPGITAVIQPRSEVQETPGWELTQNVIRTHVISRPCLSVALVDVGRLIWTGGPPGSAGQLMVADPPGARVIGKSLLTTCLELSGRALDLVIGDPVQLMLADE